VPLSQAAHYKSDMKILFLFFSRPNILSKGIQAYKKVCDKKRHKRNKNAPIISQSEPIQPNANKKANNTAIGNANPT